MGADRGEAALFRGGRSGVLCQGCGDQGWGHPVTPWFGMWLGGSAFSDAHWFGVWLGGDALTNACLVWDLFGVGCAHQCLGCGWGAMLSLMPRWFGMMVGVQHSHQCLLEHIWGLMCSLMFGMWLGDDALTDAPLVWDVVGV